MNTSPKYNALIVALCILGSIFLVKLALSDAEGAVPSDPAPAAKFGKVGVVCDDGGTNHATAIPIQPAGGNTLFIQNLDTSNPIYCGSSAAVTASTGVQVAAGGSLSIDIRLNADNGPGFYCTKDTCNGSTTFSQPTTGLNNTRWLGVR